MAEILFLSYSRRDAEKVALSLADQLTQGPPSFKVWVDRRQLQPGNAWDEQLVEALRSCSALLYLMTADSVHPSSGCKHEWTRALKYKKPIIPLLFDCDAELPYRLEPREYIDFTRDYPAALARLREHLRWRATPEGQLHALREQIEDARRDRDHAEPADRERLQEDLQRLDEMLENQRRSIEHPEEAAHRADESIQRGVQRERQPEQPLTPASSTRFINRPPAVAPSHFQGRRAETRSLGDFLLDPSLRLMTVVGRGGVGKTALVCRLLKALEGGRLPDDRGALSVDGIVYLSAAGGRAISFPNLYADLGRLLPEQTAQRLQSLQREASVSAEARALALLEAFPSGRTLVLLDNFEDLVDQETLAIRDAELNTALRWVLGAPPHGVKLILTTRVRPSELLRLRPALQRVVDLDEGLESPFAENVLRAMDPTGKLRLRDATPELLALARERTRGYPRALEALVGILTDDTGTTLAELLEDLAGLLPNAADVVEALVGEAFNRLDASAEQVMQALAIYGAPVPPVALDYLLQPHRVGIDSTPVLRRLVNQQFARREAGHFHIHPVDRQYALSASLSGSPRTLRGNGGHFPELRCTRARPITSKRRASRAKHGRAWRIWRRNCANSSCVVRLVTTMRPRRSCWRLVASISISGATTGCWRTCTGSSWVKWRTLSSRRPAWRLWATLMSELGGSRKRCTATNLPSQSLELALTARLRPEFSVASAMHIGRSVTLSKRSTSIANRWRSLTRSGRRPPKRTHWEPSRMPTPIWAA